MCVCKVSVPGIKVSSVITEFTLSVNFERRAVVTVSLLFVFKHKWVSLPSRQVCGMGDCLTRGKASGP